MKRRHRLAPQREGGLTTIVITRSMTLLLAFAVLICVFTAVLVSSLNDIRRMVYGVRPKVSLENRIVQGLLAEEVRQVVEAMAEQERTAPRDAMFFKETGELILEAPGLDIDVDLTVERVMKAKPGDNVELARTVIAPTITRRHFNAVYRVDTARKAMAVTVNVAWGEEYLPLLLDILRANNMKATFFIDGEWAEKFPDMVRLLSEEGHELASHGYEHVHVEKMNEPSIRQLISDNEKLLISLGVQPSKLFAPPYGECNQTVVSASASLGYTTVMWTIDTLDWKTEDPGKVISRVTSKAVPGAIILAHPTKVFLEALPKIIEDSRKAGYQFLTVSDLLKTGEGD